MTIFTIGHSTRPFEEFTGVLQSQKITLLVDVRAIPRSRFYPQFNRSFLETELPMRYLWMGETLGGKNAHLIPEVVFEQSIDELVRLSEAEKACIMCSEREPTPTKWRKSGCHRWFSITPALEKRGVEVVHL